MLRTLLYPILCDLAGGGFLCSCSRFLATCWEAIVADLLRCHTLETANVTVGVGKPLLTVFSLRGLGATFLPSFVEGVAGRHTLLLSILPVAPLGRVDETLFQGLYAALAQVWKRHQGADEPHSRNYELIYTISLHTDTQLLIVDLFLDGESLCTSSICRARMESLTITSIVHQGSSESVSCVASSKLGMLLGRRGPFL
jgi:hypothetical protein